VFDEAVIYLEQASRLGQDIVMWEAMVECHLELNNKHLASQIARNLMDQHSDLALTLIIAGKVAQHEQHFDIARKLYSRSMGMTQASNSAQAMIAYVDLEIATERYEAAKHLLESKVPVFHTDWMYAKLGEVSVLLMDWKDAALHFNFAMSLNPNNQQAQNGMDKLSNHFRPEEADMDEDDLDEEEL
jgi:tetratricopeptide (TPR) repeat protein